MAALSCVFLLLMIHLTAAQLSRPTNVTLYCHNTKNILHWSYEQPTPGLKFKVEIGSSDGEHSPVWVDSPTLQADVSYLTDPNGEYSLKVAAVIGGNQSESSRGLTFSYFQNSQVDQKCSLDLPLVNVTFESDDKVMFRFQHPWLFFQQNLDSISKPNLQKKNKRHRKELPIFNYDVEINDTFVSEKQPFKCMDEVCEETISVDPEPKTLCLKITGEMEKMHVLGTKEYCVQPMKASDVGRNSGSDGQLSEVEPAEETPGPSWRNSPSREAQSGSGGEVKPLIILAGILAAVAFFVIAVMVYRKTTLSTTPLPPSMNITSHVKQWTLGNVQDKVVVPQVEPSSPTPLLTGKELEESTPVCSPTTEYDVRMAIGVLTEDECEGESDVTKAEQKKDEYMQGTNMDEEEEEEFNSFEGHSSYEKRQVVVELAPGEKAEGYRG